MTASDAARAKSVLLAFASAVLSAGLVETGFRVRAYLQDGRRQEAALRRPSHLMPGDRASFGDLLRVSRNADVVYELRPGLNVTFLGRPVSTSAEGFRDRDYPSEKPPGVARIVGLGDSVMFGWGVGDGEDYLALLESRLGREPQGARFEVINTAVPGYNGVMELATLKEKGLRYRPDLVILGFCGNDLGLPNFLQERNDYLSPRRSFLAEFMSERLSADPSGDAEKADAGSGLVRRPEKVRWRTAQDEDLARVPTRYAHMVGLAAYDRTVKALRQLADTEGFELLVLYYPGPPQEVKLLVEANGIATFSLAPTVRRFRRSQGGRSRGMELLHVSASDPHPSAEGHRLIADALFAHLKQSGLLARLAARALTPP